MTNEEAGVSTPGPPFSLHGTEAQIEWAERIRLRVNGGFDRVAASFRCVAAKQAQEERDGTVAAIATLEEKRGEVLGIQWAGYFIEFWQEIADQVRQMIFHDPRYQEIQGKRDSRRAQRYLARRERVELREGA